jgi:DDE superfamily endonuclease
LLTRFLVRHFFPTGAIRLAGDDTVSERPGREVYGKGRRRGPVRSSRSYTAYRWGHKWVVLALLVRFPFAQRPRALPVLVALYRSPQDDRARRRRHKTPAQPMHLLLRVLLRWFPDRHFTFAGDSGYGSHEAACLARQSRGRLTVVSKLPADANLYEPAPPYKGRGRPRVKGAKLPGPRQAVAQSPRLRLNVAWYGGGRRDVEVVSGVGHWYKGGQGLVAARWVYVHDVTGTHRDEYFYGTDVTMTPQEVLERYTQRWNIETTFAEMRAHLGLETTRGRCRRTVERAEPCLFGLSSVVAAAYRQLPQEAQQEGGVDWEGKRGVTFSDALCAVRRWPWTSWVLARAGHEDPLAILPESLREALLYALAPAA